VIKIFNNKEAAIRFWKLIAFIAALFLLIFFIRAASYEQDRWFFTLFDDAMISMTYARTLADTGELVWFPGAERVQGFTNLLWTLYMALLHYLGLVGSQVSAAITLTSIICLVGSSFLCARLVSRAIPQIENQWLWGFSVGAIIPLLYPLVYWSLRGMEVGLLCFLALSSMALGLAYENNENRAKSKLIFTATLLASATGILIRLDFATLVFVIAVLQFSLSENKKSLLLFTTAHLGVIVLAILAVLAFQFFYFGDMVPNTYRLKVEGYAVIDRVLNGIVTIKNVAAIIFLVTASAWIALKNKHHPINRIILIASGVFLTASAYSIWVGGDAWEWSRMANRYVSVALPFAVISIMLGAYQCFCQQELIGKHTKVKIFFVLLCVIYLTIFIPRPLLKGLLLALVLTALISFFCYQLYRGQKKLGYGASQLAMSVSLLLTLVSGWGGINWLFFGGMHVKDDFEMSKRGAYLKQVTTEKAVIATVWAGAPAYYSERSMIDLLGKSDREIASMKPIGKIHPGHNKWNYEYSIGILRPDVVFQLWLNTDSDKEKLKEWGYVEKCFLNERMGYFLIRSDAIHWPLLKECKG
jgi:arabinofuranosyltransferase